MTTDTILLTGGRGRTGRRIEQLLREHPVTIRRGTRRPIDAADTRFDWDEPATWQPALRGARSAYLCFSPDLAFPGASDTIAAVAETALRAGVERLVLLSGRGEDGAVASEQAVLATGVGVVLRSSWFAQNFSEHFLLGPVRRGRLVLPAAGFAEPFVDLDDLALVARDALLGLGSIGVVHELTGSRLLTFDDVALELSAATGRSVVFEPGTVADFVADVGLDGIPAEEAEPLGELFETILDGRNASLTSDLAGALGRAPTDFTDYARRAAASGVWDLARVVR